MISAEIAHLVAQGESETLEFKKTTGERVEAAKTICAMLNHRGGVALIGVAEDGTVVARMWATARLSEWRRSCKILTRPFSPP